jgi:hypothetical protein
VALSAAWLLDTRLDAPVVVRHTESLVAAAVAAATVWAASAAAWRRSPPPLPVRGEQREQEVSEYGAYNQA